MDGTQDRADVAKILAGDVAAFESIVGREASAPPPIAFPWVRAIPGMIAAGIAIVACFVWGVRGIVVARADGGQFPIVVPGWLSVVLRGFMNPSVGWIALTVMITYLAMKFCMRMAVR